MAKNRRQAQHRSADKPPPASPAQKTLRKEGRICFDYIKSNCFRVIRVDGVTGSPTPKGDGIQMAFFSERLPIPKNEEYLLGTDGKLGKRMKIEARPAIIREVEVEAILSVPVAKSLHMWLGERIKEAEVAATGGTPNVK